MSILVSLSLPVGPSRRLFLAYTQSLTHKQTKCKQNLENNRKSFIGNDLEQKIFPDKGLRVSYNNDASDITKVR